MLVSATATAFCWWEISDEKDLATAEEQEQDNSSNNAKDQFFHLPKHDGRTNDFHCKECSENAGNDRCFAIGFSVQFMAIAKFSNMSFSSERLLGIRNQPHRSDVSLPCAYPRATALPTCLNIPIQLNMAHFPFPALALIALGLSSANNTDCERR